VPESCGAARSFPQITGSEGAERQAHEPHLHRSLVPVWRTRLHGKTDTGGCQLGEAAAGLSCAQSRSSVLAVVFLVVLEKLDVELVDESMEEQKVDNALPMGERLP